MSEPPAAFLSYAHVDNDENRITQFAGHLERETRQQAGQPFPIFRDRRDLKWGEAWRQRIDGALEQVTFLICILSPSFFRSPECLREVEKFREREQQLGRNDLILGVAWIDWQHTPPLNPDLAMLLKERQFADWRQYRHHRNYPLGARNQLGEMARQIVARLAVVHSPHPGETRIHPADGLTYVWIPPGEFEMGASPGDQEASKDEKPRYLAEITRGFWMGQIPVTQAAYEKVTGKNPSRFKGPDRPVERVSWDEARRYCEAVGGRLPTEAEWEYAARAGSEAARYGELDAIAWFSGNSGGETHPVKSKEPNAWGLHDTLGNVWEWIADWYGDRYYVTLPSPAIDPKGPETGESRVLRGGSWNNNPRLLRVSFRDGFAAGYRISYIGFRCTREGLP